MKHPESTQKSRKAVSKKRYTARTSSGQALSSASNAMHTASVICAQLEVKTINQVVTVFTTQAREKARVQEHLHNVQSTRERIRQAIADAVHLNFNAPAIHATAPLDDYATPPALAPLVRANTAPTLAAPGTRITSSSLGLGALPTTVAHSVPVPAVPLSVPVAAARFVAPGRARAASVSHHRSGRTFRFRWFVKRTVCPFFASTLHEALHTALSLFFLFLLLTACVVLLPAV